MTRVTLNLDNIIHLSDDQFFQLCQTNPDLRFERSATGELTIMTLVGGESSNQNAEITTDLNLWNRQFKKGLVFGSSTGFKLPSGANHSPDSAWIAQDRWESLTPEQRQKFPPLAPDFVIELRSETDALKPLQAKMQEYLENGVRLGWLIDPQNRQVEIYRPDRPVEMVQLPTTLSGEDVLDGFTLKLD